MPTTIHPQRRSNWHDAYDQQMALWRFYRTDMGLDYLRWHMLETTTDLRRDTQEMLRSLYQSEAIRLLDCDPIYISAEMCEVVDAAKDTFEPEPLLETDLLTPRGFVYFERPFVIPDRFDRPVSIHAFSWTRTIAHDDATTVLDVNREGMPEGTDPRAWEEHLIEKHGAYANGVAITLYEGGQAPRNVGYPFLLPMHLTPWYFNMSFDGNEVDENGVPTGAGWWWRIVQVTLRLMQQRIAVKHMQRPDRASRREAKRLKMPDDQEIVVVRLRREASEGKEPTGEEANYSHRFIVSGHWRNQPYPKEGIHRQIWISPYVKGPEDKPLIVRPRRVYQWNR